MKKPKEYLNDAFCLIEDGKTVEAHTHIVEKVMRKYAEDFFNEQVQFHYFEVKKGQKDEADRRTEM
jgi:hypothetical protein